eukprot:2800714-Rhodomonas_salina.1
MSSRPRQPACGLAAPHSVSVPHHTARASRQQDSIWYFESGMRVRAGSGPVAVSYTHLRAHETEADL